LRLGIASIEDWSRLATTAFKVELARAAPGGAVEWVGFDISHILEWLHEESGTRVRVVVVRIEAPLIASFGFAEPTRACVGELRLGA
jgi:hypothetical protein